MKKDLESNILSTLVDSLYKTSENQRKAADANLQAADANLEAADSNIKASENYRLAVIISCVSTVLIAFILSAVILLQNFEMTYEDEYFGTKNSSNTMKSVDK